MQSLGHNELCLKFKTKLKVGVKISQFITKLDALLFNQEKCELLLGGVSKQSHYSKQMEIEMIAIRDG